MLRMNVAMEDLKTHALNKDMAQDLVEWLNKIHESDCNIGTSYRLLQETMDRFAAKLESVYTASGGKKLNIISHSMGGLLVKCFMSLHSDIFEKYVKNWIAIAAPFRGAPGYITTSLLNGMSFVEGWEQNLFISKWSMQQLLIECPSIYELMACPNFDWQSTPLLEIWREKHDSNGNSGVMLESYEPAEAISILKEALSSNTVNYNGVDIVLPFNLEILKWANQTQEVMSSAKVPTQVKFYNIYGTNYDTPHSVCYGSEQTPVTDLHRLLSLKGNYVCVDGDGTVPVESAKADGLNAEARVGVPGDHRGIICDRHVFRILKHWLRAGDLDPFYNPLNDYVILPTAFEIEKKQQHHHQEDKEGGLPQEVVTSLKEEWEIISKDHNQEDDHHQGGTLAEKAHLLKASISVSHVGLKDQSPARAAEVAHATIVVQQQRHPHWSEDGKQHVDLRALSVVSMATAKAN
ncbi:Lecithin:cholesterol/phospholipid:diacylglycerol acyltransferase [Macleaya cordata]|uniref:Lecithin:cholesterol/phospholipid:diacylglycerol acyltransferase n=1 Tax=Macleaya cordata TaxID=56857 RepID=A0A200PVB6_MACCD|nr:Lecithin:cholesterol/phospholipid:diacylglycerol acyltransferase [Macleaya cordata]